MFGACPNAASTVEIGKAVGRDSGSAKTEAKGAGQALKGKAQQAAGKARSTAKKKTR
jgi:uncharacterized protein YjbJ (UPF0337 family)